jgi:hypothetical protein
MSDRVPGNPWPIVNRSGTIADGGTAQALLAANSQRRGFWVYNLSSEDIWISELGAATQSQPSIRIPAGALYESAPGTVPTGAISIIAATTGSAYSAREW